MISTGYLLFNGVNDCLDKSCVLSTMKNIWFLEFRKANILHVMCEIPGKFILEIILAFVEFTANCNCCMTLF